MKCARQGCVGVMHRFHPKHLVTAVYRTDTGVMMELGDLKWKHLGLMCDTCGYLEFYAQDPRKVLRESREFFERTEPEP